MLSAHAQHSAGNQTLYIWVFLLQTAHMIAPVVLSTFVIMLHRQC